jgi:hypothetical protein
MRFVPRPSEAAGQGHTRAGGTDRGPTAARFSPKDHYGGDACIGYFECNEEFPAANAAPTAGCRCLGRQDGGLSAGVLLPAKRRASSAPSGAAGPDPPTEPLVPQVRQSLRWSHTQARMGIIAAACAAAGCRTFALDGRASVPHLHHAILGDLVGQYARGGLPRAIPRHVSPRRTWLGPDSRSTGCTDKDLIAPE